MIEPLGEVCREALEWNEPIGLIFFKMNSLIIRQPSIQKGKSTGRVFSRVLNLKMIFLGGFE